MHVYIIMGVSGVGKTSIGKKLSDKLGLPFYDADDYHPPENISKMESGIPLKDSDREAWLSRLSEEIRTWYHSTGAVLACSALKQRYREQLTSIPEKDLTWIFLHSEYDTIYQRLTSREQHFFEPELLQTQYDILEIPASGIHVDVEAGQQEIIQEIMDKLNQQSRASAIGVVGLGVMGKSLALNIASRDIPVSVFNRKAEGEENIAKDFAAENRESYQIPWFDDLKTFIESLEHPRKIFLMISAGKAIDQVIESLVPKLQEGDVIIDGGNSHFQDTERRGARLEKEGILFVGCGISGGEEGALKGPSIMPGGSPEAYETVEPILKAIAAKDQAENPCCSFIGKGGAGHFVKMVHNGIEYGEMQLIAEIYHFLRHHQDTSVKEIADLFERWNRNLQSFLLEATVDILRKKEEEKPLIDKILDAAGQKGTGGWSTVAAIDLGVPLDTITAAVMARNVSARKEQREKASRIHRYIPGKDQTEGGTEGLYRAFRAGSIINHAIGFDLLKEASKEYQWELDLSEIARVWTNGCIIRSRLMEDFSRTLRKNPEHILLDHDIAATISEYRKALAETLGRAAKAGSPIPVLAAAHNYLLGFSTAEGSASIIQAQRDYFGAHTYERIDRPRGEFHHSHWSVQEPKP